MTKNIKELCGFLGLTEYYRKFVANYGSIALPLTQLLKKEKFSWNVEVDEACQRLKSMMVEILILGLPNFKETFEIESDASGVGTGKCCPLAYFSQALLSTHRYKAVYEWELMAILFAIQKWRSYLLERHFVVRTNQKSLNFLLEQRVIAGEYQRWIAKLLGYDFHIEYKHGREN